MKDGIRIGGVFKFICKDVVSGRLKWQDEARNLIVDEGCNHLLDVLLQCDVYDHSFGRIGCET
jgi:hypothetical protein